MTGKAKKLQTRFHTGKPFAIKPTPFAISRRRQALELERMKLKHLQAEASANTDADPHGLFRQSASEAAALAWATGYPLLFFPGLFEEKARQVRSYLQRQRMVQERSRLTQREAA